MLSAMDKYSDWHPKAAAVQLLNTSERTLDRLINRGQIQTAQRRVPGRKPIVVCNPADVERIRAETAQPQPFVLPAEVAASPMSPTAPSGRMPLPELLRAVVDGRHVPRFLTLPEASRYVGLPEAYLRRLVRSGELRSIRAGSWRVRRVDLDAL